jgi:Spy/CpxP family protein refolding chaperone
MKALRAEHLATMTAEMTKRDDAVKAFYAVLTPEQQKTFDAEHARLAAQRDHARHGGPGRTPAVAPPSQPAK